LEFSGHPDRIVCASKFLIRKSRGILFSLLDQEISRSFDFGKFVLTHIFLVWSRSSRVFSRSSR
jgi:hypothetical protein